MAAGGRILALGGHELGTTPSELAITEHLLALTGAERPRVCVLPTASGDPYETISSAYLALDRFDCRPSHLSLFRLEHERVDVRRHLLGQDLIYVCGGSLLNLLAVWRAHAVPALMGEALERGVLLAGQSAGAMCWFEHAITASGGQPRPATGLGFLPGSLSVHLGRDPARREAYLAAVAAGMPGGYALDDGAGLLFEGRDPPRPFAGRPDARVVEVRRTPLGVSLRALEPTVLACRRPRSHEDVAIEERRLLRRATHRPVRRRLALRTR